MRRQPATPAAGTLVDVLAAAGEHDRVQDVALRGRKIGQRSVRAEDVQAVIRKAATGRNLAGLDQYRQARGDPLHPAQVAWRR